MEPKMDMDWFLRAIADDPNQNLSYAEAREKACKLAATEELYATLADTVSILSQMNCPAKLLRQIEVNCAALKKARGE